MSAPQASPASIVPEPGSPEPSPLDFLIALGQAKRTLLLWPLVAAAVAAGVSLLIPNTYTAVTRILPPQQAPSMATAMLNQLGGLASVASGVAGLKNPNDLYASMLKSNTLTDALITRFDLKTVYREAYLSKARKRLDKHRQVKSDKGGVISIEIEAHDPKLAADIANGHVEELHKLTGTLAVTEAAQRRLFFERQLQLTNQKLAEAEGRLRQALDAGGLVSVDVQGRAAIETTAKLRATISAKEVQIGAMQAYAAPGNPELRRAEEELASLRRELARLESGGRAGARAAGGSDAKGVDNIKLLRDVKYHETMFEMLAKQFELARIDESKEAPIVQILDRAHPPDRKSGPPRTLIVLAVFAAAFSACAWWIWLRYELARRRADTVEGPRLEALRRAWRKDVR